MPVYVCSAGHLVRAEGSQISIDSLCGRCKAAALRARGLRPAAELAATKPHGTRIRYVGGCRCDACRAANSAYERIRQKARREGDWNGVVDAGNARAHLRKLSRQGVGKNAVAAASDVPRSVIHEIRLGRKPRIRARTERRILAVTKAMASDRALVSAARTWRLLEDLLEEGYRKGMIARRLGYRGYGIQLSRGQVTVRNAARVERLHRELTT